MIATYLALVPLAATAFFGNVFVGILAALVLVEAPLRVRRWLRTRHAFAALHRHRKQQMAAGWWLAFLLVCLLMISWARRGLGR